MNERTPRQRTNLLGAMMAAIASASPIHALRREPDRWGGLKPKAARGWTGYTKPKSNRVRMVKRAIQRQRREANRTRPQHAKLATSGRACRDLAIRHLKAKGGAA